MKEFITSRDQKQEIEGKKLTVMPALSTIRNINSIYKKFFSQVKKKAINQTQSLFIFVFKFYANKYSKVSHVNKKFKELLVSCQRNSQNARVKLFSRFMGINSFLDEQCFILYYEIINYLQKKRNYEAIKTNRLVYFIPIIFLYEMLQNVLPNHNINQSTVDQLKTQVKKIKFRLRAV